MAVKKKTGRLSAKARKAEEKREAERQKRSASSRKKAPRAAAKAPKKDPARVKAAKKGWLTRKATEAELRQGAKSKTRKPIFDDDFDFDNDYVDVIGVDSAYEEE
jgi:hypothetical protein